MIRDVFARLEPVAARLGAIAPGEERPFDTVVDEQRSATRASIGGREVRMFGANGYLGLAHDPDVIEAARRALACGTGTTGSRVANGTTAAHRALERAFARATGRAHGMVFTTGHQANLSVVATLCGPDDAVVLDAEAHASLVDAARLAGSRVVLFRHNQPDDLRRKLAAVADRAALVAVEGLYSISGDTAPLGEIVAVCREAGARLLVDEAHGFGVYGARGLGVAEHAGVLDQVDVLVGTFSKALGGVGGFAVSDHPAFPLLHFAARAYLFTASGSPATIAAAHAALERIVDPVAGPELRRRLWRAAHRLREGLVARGVDVGPAVSPIVRVRLGAADRAVAAWRRALALGVYTNLVLSPGAPRGAEGLRVSVCAAHTDEDIDEAVAALATAVEDACRTSC